MKFIVNIGDLIADQVISEIISVSKAFSSGLVDLPEQERTTKGIHRIVKTAWISENDGNVGPIEDSMYIFYLSERKLDGFNIDLDMWWTGDIQDLESKNHFCISFGFGHDFSCGDSYLEFCDREDFFGNIYEFISKKYIAGLKKYIKENIDYAEEHKKEVVEYEKQKREEMISRHYAEVEEYKAEKYLRKQ